MEELTVRAASGGAGREHKAGVVGESGAADDDSGVRGEDQGAGGGGACLARKVL